MDLQVRKARRKDLPAVVALLAQLGGEERLSLAAAARIHREMCKYPSYSCYLALVEREPVGTFTLLVLPTLAPDGTREALVDGVVVATNWRGRGIGGAMMAEAMRLAAEEGCYNLALLSHSKHEDASRFYRSLGFRQRGVTFWIDIMPLGNAQQAVRELVTSRG